MNSIDFDIIIVGSGPAGVSSAFPLVDAGFKVLMIDGGKEANEVPPALAFLDERKNNNNQWSWMIGKDFHAFKQMDAVSPKLRVPGHAYVFNEFSTQNHIEAQNFIVAGSLAKGGLSNAWGCGVACFSSEDFKKYPVAASEFKESYKYIAARMGISGAIEDDLSTYFGLDEWIQRPLPLDKIHTYLASKYEQKKPELHSLGFKLGRSRVAAISEDHADRKACNLSGNCLWGCGRRSLYSAAYDLETLRGRKNFSYKGNVIVEKITKNEDGYILVCKDGGRPYSIATKKIIMAAGTLATTRIVLDALGYTKPVKLESCPTAAFLMWLPGMLGKETNLGFGLGQLSFNLHLSNGISAFGSTFNITGMPVTEFVRHVPFKRRYGIDIMRNLLPSCVVGNVFLPGNLSSASVVLNNDGKLKISGGYKGEVKNLMAETHKKIRSAYLKLGALLLPMSFKIGLPGGDIHYAATLPMQNNPVVGETNPQGEVCGLKGVFVVDGACLTALPEKSHTLTIMANADRIARRLVSQIHKESEWT